jgi:alpha-L-rhamnosidase
MANVPENQRVEAPVNTKFNNDFAAKAAQLQPRIHEWLRWPQQVVRFEPDEQSFFGVRPIFAHTVESIPGLVWGKGDEFVLDFGLHLVGYTSFKISGRGINVDAPVRIRFVFGETPRDVAEELYPCDTWISTSWLPDEVLNIDDVPSDIELARRHAFRYLRVQILDTSPKFKASFSEFRVRTVSAVSPETKIPNFIFSTTILEAIDKTCIFTLRDCMQSVYEDGPRRDRRLWIGDLRLQALANYSTTRDFTLVKRCLYLFAALSRSDGSLPACIFERKTGISGATDYIVDYDALFGVIVYDYVVASGDILTGNDLWETIMGSMRIPLAHVSATGAFQSSATSHWKFLDWSKEPLDTDAGSHGLLLYCCKTINNLAVILGRPEPYNDLIDILSSPQALSSFYDEERHCFVSGPLKQVSIASAAWLTLSGAFPKDICRTALHNALSDTSSIKPRTPYLFHYLTEALTVCGAEDMALALIIDYWGAMIVNAQADTFWECFDRSNPRASPYGPDCQNNSFCHAWSCTPSYFLRGPLAKLSGAVERGVISLQELDQERIGKIPKQSIHERL